ncbi:MAG: redox-sensing transcriptional repressor Rex [Firmicutes bacterium]|nr:redox-sensing transcriptional repressor Rex [Dethiobacter sp.]MBS3889282.1 redox-sensing transcriptional repressor Rex [Bacillota bacterium]MBS4053174.1 redox-sensing transcriptional repressor Rex [Thermaerobacter sp.]
MVVQIPRPTIERLPLYLRCLTRLASSGVEVVSSEELGKLLAITSVQIRKDLAYFGEFGRRGVGYDVSSLLAQVSQILGVDRARKLALVGVGHLGQALANYDGFREHGFNISAVFDADPSKIGLTIAGQRVLPVHRIGEMLPQIGVEMAILAVPAHAAQKVTDALVQAGIKAIWNFAPVRLIVPDHVEIRQENMIVGLLALSYYLAQRGK